MAVSDTGDRLNHRAMLAAERFAVAARDALHYGINAAYLLALMDLREALEQLPPDPVP